MAGAKQSASISITGTVGNREKKPNAADPTRYPWRRGRGVLFNSFATAQERYSFTDIPLAIGTRISIKRSSGRASVTYIFASTSQPQTV
jgi:hypothetical protein